LIDQMKITNTMVPAYVFDSIIHQSWIDIYRIIHRKYCFRLNQKIKHGNKYNAKEKKKYQS